MDINFFPVPQIELLFTEKCNLNCTYCFEHNKLNRSMNLDEILSLTQKKGISSRSFYMFGGEPMLAMDIITGLIDSVNAQTDISEATKSELLSGLTFHITNGTLLKQNLDIIKKYGMSIQISVDGPKEINDANRVYHDGRGSFNEVYEAIKLCHDEKIPWSIHGAVGVDTIKNLFEITKFYFDVYYKYESMDKAIGVLKGNIYQLMFEGNYTDEDVNELLSQFSMIVDWIWTTKDYNLTSDQRRTMFINWCTRRGSSCFVGDTLYSMDAEYNLYPCHRLAMSEYRKTFSLGNMKETIRDFDNYEIFNSITKMHKDNCMFSSAINVIEWDSPLYWMNWCPATNSETHLSPYYQASKYNVIIAELNSFIPELAHYYGVDIDVLEKRVKERN